VKRFFQEGDNGQLSMARLLSFMLVGSGIINGSIAYLISVICSLTPSYVFPMFLVGSGISAKLIQKPFENK
jgi:hypothetical protein